MEDFKSELENKIKRQFRDRFSRQPEALIQAPGRVNLIGEHTDFNHGFVLPMAIDKYLAVAASKRADHLVKVVSMDFNAEAVIDLNSLQKGEHSWIEYVTGCLWAMKEHGYEPKGFECVMAGNIPVGAGLSSSAALEMAVLSAAAWSAGFTWDKVTMAKVGQFVENEWIGVSCGVMDQIISAAGVHHHAMLIDCNDLSLKQCPVPEDAEIVVLDTTTRRGLVDSAYNERREQCFGAAKTMDIDYLGQADQAMLEAYRSKMDTLSYLRAKHVVLENQRVQDAAAAMAQQDSNKLGKLMYQSHVSLRDDFEVSSDALNAIVESAMRSDSCFGARMTGAGFGGCAVALIKKDSEHLFSEAVRSGYSKQIGLEPLIFICQPSDGVTLKEL